MRALGLAASFLVVLVAAAGVFAIREAVSGDSESPIDSVTQVTPLPSDIEHATPVEPLDLNATPRPCSDPYPNATQYDPIRAGGVDVPVPFGSGLSAVGKPRGETWGPEGPPYTITCGASVVTFDGLGIFPSQTLVQPEDAAKFKATLDALALLGTRPEPTQPPIPFGDVLVPVPTGAIITTAVGEASDPPMSEISLGSSFVRFNKNGLLASSIEPEHEDAFAPTLAAIAQLGASN